MSDHVKLIGRALRTQTLPHGCRTVVLAGENILINMLRDEKNVFLGRQDDGYTHANMSSGCFLPLCEAHKQDVFYSGYHIPWNSKLFFPNKLKIEYQNS